MNARHLLDNLGITPKKSLGQNFLQDPNALEKIAAAAEISSTDQVLEVGPGTGALTVKLAQRAGRLVAVEIDGRLIPVLERQVGDFPHVEILHKDILDVDLGDLFGEKPYKVVANLPYYITSAILRHLLEAEHRPERLVLTVQQEVAERLVAKPGEMSLLSVSAQFYGQLSIVGKISPSAFWPSPAVASAIVRIDVFPTPAVDVPDSGLFFDVVRAGFGQKRKQLKNSLSSGLDCSQLEAARLLEQAGIDPMRRAETLSLPEWGALVRAFAIQRARV